MSRRNLRREEPRTMRDQSDQAEQVEEEQAEEPPVVPPPVDDPPVDPDHDGGQGEHSFWVGAG